MSSQAQDVLPAALPPELQSCKGHWRGLEQSLHTAYRGKGAGGGSYCGAWCAACCMCKRPAK